MSKELFTTLIGAVMLGMGTIEKKPFVAPKITLTKKQKKARAKNKVQRTSRKVNR